MTSQTNTFRLQRLTKTMTMKEPSKSEHQPKQNFKLVAINSISKGIRHSDVSFLSGRESNKLRHEPELFQNLQSTVLDAHTNLTQIRKNFDSIYSAKNIREKSLDKLNEEKRKLSLVQRELIQRRNSTTRSIRGLSQKCQRIKQTAELLQLRKRNMQHMIFRLKQDQVVYRHRKNQLEQELQSLGKTVNMLRIQNKQVNSLDGKGSKIEKQFAEKVQKEKQQMQMYLNQIQALCEEKQRISQNNQFRNRQIHQIAYRAMQDKDENQKKWHCIYLSHRFLQKMLRAKMQRQMQKFFVIQNAFKNIKIQTRVPDAQSFVNKFLNKEKQYGQLLGKIAQNQKIISELRSVGDSLRKQQKQLQAQKQTLDTDRKSQINLQGDLKKLNEVTVKMQKTQLETEKVRSWLMRTNLKMNNILGTKLQVNLQRDPKTISEKFVQYLKVLSNELGNIQNLPMENISIEGPNLSQIEQLREKKSSLIKDHSRKGSLSVENIESSQKKQKNDNLNENDNDNENEEDLIQFQRQQILRNNDKFMKEARRKYQQQRRLMVEMGIGKKKEEKVVVVKKVQED